MSHMKQALSIVRFEFKHSLPYFLFQLILIGFLLYLFLPTIPQYFSDSYLGLDLFFIVIVTTFSQFFVAKPFKSQALENGFWGSHFLILLNQLAIPKQTIVIYRFISFYGLTSAFTGLFLLMAYLLSPFLQEQISFPNYLVFIIFWICVAITFGGIQPVSDTGMNLIFSIIVTLLIIGPIAFLIILYLFYVIYPNGLVHWSLMIATKWPLQTILISVTVATISCRKWLNIMKKRMTKLDYFS